MKKLFLIVMTSLLFFSSFSRDKSSLKFHLVDHSLTVESAIPDNLELIQILKGMEVKSVLVEKEVQLDGSHIKNFEITSDFTGRPSINFSLDEEGTEIFAKLTRENLRKEILLEMDGIAIFSAVITSEISGGQVGVSGMDNLVIFKIIKENFECEDYLELNFDVEFVKVEQVSDTVDRKDPKAVINAFIYYLITDDPMWKDFVLKDKDYSQNFENIQKKRENFPEGIKYTDIEIENIKGFDTKLPSYVFRKIDYLPVPCMYKLNISGFDYIGQINLLIDKKGKFYIQ